MAPSSGERVGRYVLGARIADGPRGSVYRATQDVSGRVVALKVLRPEGAEDVTRLVASARSGAALDHPNIAAVVEVGTQDACLFVARELVQGAPIGVRAKGAPLADRIRWLIAAAGALHAAHRRGVVHGAVREGNVLIEEDGTLKLTDFAMGDSAEAADDRRGWIDLARAIIETPEITASIRDALQAAEGDDGSLDRAASMLEAALDEPVDMRDAIDAPDAIEAPSAPRVDAIDEIVPAGTLRTRSREPSQVPRFVLVALIIACSLVVLYATRRRASPRAIEAHGAAVASNASGDAPARSPQAVALFNGAMQSMRDASIDQARATLDEALKIDPSYASAHLRRALLSVFIDDTSREHFARAMSLRSALSPHERTLLDAFEPSLGTKPLSSESVERMTIAASLHPDDAEYAFYLGFAHWLAGDFRGAVGAMDRALSLDPRYAIASRTRAYLLFMLDETAEAMAEYEHCIALSPAATACLYGLAEMQTHEGQCREAEATSRRMIAVVPSSASSYYSLALALFAQHQDEAASLALDEHIRRVPIAERSAKRFELETRRAILGGDFPGAERVIASWESAIAGVPNEWQHYGTTELRMELDLETGRSREAIEAGNAFLARQGVLTRRANHSDARLLVEGAMHRAGGISSTALDALREEELARVTDGGPSWETTARKEQAWIWAYVPSIATPEDANAALAALPRYPPLPPVSTRHPIEVDGMLGRVLLLAHKPEQAVPLLRRSARSCLALESPLFHTQLLALLGDAERAQGDTISACADYAEVIRRWGQTLGSRTARAAISGAEKLRCAEFAEPHGAK